MAPQCYIIRTLPVLLSMYAQLHVPAPSASHHHNFSSVKVYKNELLTEEKLHTSQNLPFCVKKWVIELQNRLNAPKELGLFLQPTLMHNSITACMSHYYPPHVSGLDMPILRRNNCTNTASGILALFRNTNVGIAFKATTTRSL